MRVRLNGGSCSNGFSCGIPGGDTSQAGARDDDPNPDGNVYDLDSPGMDIAKWNAPVNVTKSLRANFIEYAVYGATGAKTSADLPWFARVSALRNSSGAFQYSAVGAGDNQAAVGQTSLSLQ